MNEKMRYEINRIIKCIDARRYDMKQKYAADTYNKRSGKFRKREQDYLNYLTTSRNALVRVLNYDATGEIQELEALCE